MTHSRRILSWSRLETQGAKVVLDGLTKERYGSAEKQVSGWEASAEAESGNAMHSPLQPHLFV